MSGSTVSIALERFTTFGDLLKYLRRCSGLTQRELSIAVGYSDTQISRLEQNERLPDLATVSARFLPVLHLENQPEVSARLLELASLARREDAPIAGLPPYKGLYCFDEPDADLFFGRETLTTTLVGTLFNGLKTGQRFLGVIGASGSGKSSLVRAGLLPALRWQQPSANWPVYVMKPSAHPLEILAASLTLEPASRQTINKLASDLLHDSHMLQNILEHTRTENNHSNSLFLIDQFEELFTLCRSEEEQAAFINNLLTAAFHPNGIAIVVIVMRADFYAHCARFDMLREALPHHQLFIGQMTIAELRRAIEEPARSGHWEIEAGLTDLLLHDVGADKGHSPEPGALPLLSHALLETWRRRRGRMLTLSGYSASGGVRGAITETAEAVFYDQLESQQRNIARQIFLRLTELGGETTDADTRRRISFDELSFKLDDKHTVLDVLKTLADARLVTIDQDTAEVAHEALIRAWPTLRNWLEEDREGLRLHRHLTEAARDWEASAQDPSGLYRGARLAQAQEWTASHQEDVNLLERSFLDASQNFAEQEAAEREAQRQRELDAAHQLAETERMHAEKQLKANKSLRKRAIFLAIAFVLAGALALVTLFFNQRAITAEKLSASRELAAAAGNNLSKDPDLSILLALQALQESNTLEARNALHQALPEQHLLFSAPAHARGAADIVFSPDNNRVASIGEDRTAKIWDANNGQLIMTLKSDLDEFSSNILYSPDGKLLVTAWTTSITVWDAASGEEIYTFSGDTVGTSIGYNLGIGQICFSPDGKRLAIANMDGKATIWDIQARSVVLAFSSGELPAKAISYSADGHLLATAGDDGLVKVWDAINGTYRFTLTLGGIIHRVAFAVQGTNLAAASEDGTVKIWDAAKGVEMINLPPLSGMYDLTFMPNGNLITAGQDGVARVWDATTGTQILTLAGHISTIVGVAASSDGKRIATSGYDSLVKIWDAAPGREVLTIRAHQEMVWDVAYSPDGNQIASVSVDGKASLWDATSGQLIRTLVNNDQPTQGMTSLAFSPDGKSIALGSFDGVITLLDLRSGEITHKFTGHNNIIFTLVFSPDGNRLGSASWDGTAKVWDLITGNEISTFNGHPTGSLIDGIAFSLDGKQVYTCGTDVRLWNAETGQEIFLFPWEEKEPYGADISPDGKLLAIGYQDGSIDLWDVEKLEKIHTLTGHASLINRLTFNRDGTQLASASFDRLAKVWNVQSGEEIFSLYGNPSNVYGVSFSPDGQHLVAAGADGTLRTFTLRLEDLIAIAQSRVTRSLTEEECQKYLHHACP